LVLACGSRGGDHAGRASAALGAGGVYGYDVNGLLTPGGGAERVLDAIGRVVQAGDRTFAYGPDGQIATVTRGDTRVSYLYDESGERLVESVGGAPSAAFVDGVYLTPSEIDEPIRVGGRLAGLLRNGQFELLASDVRGTVQADRDGTLRPAAPYGERDVHPDVARVEDYASRGYDDDLGATRMGVRDYDPAAALFLQPDPLFLEHPDKCIDSPVECTLYGYATNRPLDYEDPTGTEATSEPEPTPPEVHETLDQMLGKVEPTTREDSMLLLGIDTVHNIFEPGDALEVAPGPPGTKQSSQEGAAYVALTYYNTRSVAQNREFAGLIYQNADKSYSYTPAARGFVANSWPHNTEDHIPTGARIVAWYHTHGGPDPRYDGEHFSRDDGEVTHEDQNPGYVITPTWHFGVLQPTLPRARTNAIGDVCGTPCSSAPSP
jgi:RHS repeat-associated protein